MRTDIVERVVALLRDPTVMPRWGVLAATCRRTASWISEHTGIPVALVAAVFLVTSYRLLKKGLRFVFHVAVVFAILAIATKLDLISW